MDLKLEQFHDEIEGYENEFHAGPRQFRARVRLWVALGYAAIAAFLLLNLAFLALLYWWYRQDGPPFVIGCGAVVALFLIFSILRSVLFRVPLPPGMVVQKADYPYLYELVESLRKPMKLRRHKLEILVDWDCNAYAFSRPAFGLMGPATHHIGLSLPLLASLSEDQLKAVLAHELAHFSRMHSGFTSWVSRMQTTWVLLLERLQKNRITGFPYRAFYRWYVRRLSAYTTVLRRHNEFEADRLAAEVVGKRALAQALLRMELRKSLVIDDHWREIWRNALIDEVPVDQAVSRLLIRLEREHLDPEEALGELRWALGEHTEFCDSHPSLSDRLQALGVDVPDPKTESSKIIGEWGLIRPESTLRKFLGKDRREAGRFLDQVWFVSHSLEWKLKHHFSAPLTKLMRELDQEWREKGRLSVEKAWKRAYITDLYYGSKATLPIVDYILKLDDTHAHANYIKGAALLREYDSTGILHIEQAIEKDPVSYQECGLALLSSYYKRMGAENDYREAKYESFAAFEETRKALQERAKPVRSFDSFESHDLSEEDCRDLAEGFARMPEIRQVHLVTKTVKHFPDSRLYVFGIVPTLGGRFKFRSREVLSTERLIFSRIHQIRLLTFSSLILRWKFRRIENSVVYRKKWFQKSKPSGESEKQEQI